MSKIKILLILFLAFILSKVSSGTIFIASTPRVNRQFFAKLKNLPLDIVNQSGNFIASLTTKSSLTQQQKQNVENFEKLSVSVMQPVAKGIYAKEDRQDNMVYIRITNDAEWEERLINYNGQQIKVRFPKGSIK